MSRHTIEQLNSAFAAVFKKAAEDAGFRATCLSDPLAAYKEASGIVLPVGAKLKFAETLQEGAIILPPLGEEPDLLSDEELEGVAGGSYGNPTSDPNNFYGPYYDNQIKALYEQSNNGF